MRNYLPEDFKVTTWEKLEPFLAELKEREINGVDELQKWMLDRSEVESVLSEDMAWRYIKMTCDTSDEALTKSYQDFVQNISPKVAPLDNELNLKLYNHPNFKDLDKERSKIYLRGLSREIEMFREENIPLFTELQMKSQEFGAVSGAQTITHNGEELTLQQAAVLLKDGDRSLREEIYNKVGTRRLEDKKKLNEIFNELVRKRHLVAKNTDYKNYRDYKHDAMGRFDYTPDDCFAFQNSIKEHVVPLMDEFHKERKEKLGVNVLKPWDLSVDPEGKKPLKPFDGGDDLLEKTILCFTKLDPYFGECLKTMREMKHLDLVSRKGKAPGGYNYPLAESGVPFIFMNATSTMRDMITMIHEGGHAVHSFLTKDMEYNFEKSTTSEVAELASMSMELITMDYWNCYFDSEDELKRAKKEHLQDALSTFPWVATIDKFQHWCYENYHHTVAERDEAWEMIMDEFGSTVIDWTGQEELKKNTWHKQLHVFEVPFYYIEYAMAQLGAIAVWKNYKENPQKGLEGYKSALKLGYTKTIGEIYEAGHIKFDFSSIYIKELVEFVKSELKSL